MKQFLKKLFRHHSTWILGSLIAVGIAMAAPAAAPALVIIAGIAIGVATIVMINRFFLKKMLNTQMTGQEKLEKERRDQAKPYPYYRVAVAILVLVLLVTALVLTIGFFTGGAGFAFMLPIFAALQAPFATAAATWGLSLSLPTLAGVCFVTAPLILGVNLSHFLMWLDSFKKDGAIVYAQKAGDEKLSNLTVDSLNNKGTIVTQKVTKESNPLEPSTLRYKDAREKAVTEIIRTQGYYSTVFSGISATVSNKFSSPYKEALAGAGVKKEDMLDKNYPIFYKNDSRPPLPLVKDAFIMIKAKKHIMVALSGGVDSAVTAWLLKEQGHEVQGLFMKNWEEDDTESYCSASQDLADVEAVCHHLDIPLHTVNFSVEYWDNVFEYFLASYRQGYTPNPDVLCNKEIKFKVFWEHAKNLGAEIMATGHYCQRKQEGDEFLLLKGQDNTKDQSYFLYTLTQEQLSRSLFPIGHLTKLEVRKLANQIGLPNYAKKDSVGICFIGERKFKQFLERYISNEPGNIETLEGEVVGKHDGLMYYTIGQRAGLGIGGRKNTTAKPWYVLDKKLENKTLIVGQGHEHPYLLTKKLICYDVHWISPQFMKDPKMCTAKTRYRQLEQPCQIRHVNDHTYEVEFQQPQWAVTPGQAIVFYHQTICLGGGFIEHVIR